MYIYIYIYYVVLLYGPMAFVFPEVVDHWGFHITARTEVEIF